MSQEAAFSRIAKARGPSEKSSNKNALHQVDVPTRKATFAMGCFWAPDALYGATLGVIRTRVGYSGGNKESPTYRDLKDHTEAIQIDYDPEIINYESLLKLFWENHDPSAKNKLQYTSFIFYHDEEQKAIADKQLEEKKNQYSRPLVTVVRPAGKFWDAEDYHQKYRLQQHSWLCEKLDCSGELLKTSYVAARLNGYVLGCGGVQQFEEELPILGLDEDTADYVRKLVTKYEGQGLVC